MDETLDDLFEIRSVFKDILTNNLSAQPQTHQYAASFAMKYIDYSDALFGCMTERLKTVSMHYLSIY